MRADPAQLATQRALRRFEDEGGPLSLACFAALPVAIDPDLLHLIRVNFFHHLLYTVESRLLLSPLCVEIGEGLYEMPLAVRELLLLRLFQTEPEERLRRMALLLWEYSSSGVWANNEQLARAQQLTALNLLAPDRARAWLEAAKEAQHGGLAEASAREWFVAMRAEIERQAEIVAAAASGPRPEEAAPDIDDGGDFAPVFDAADEDHDFAPAGVQHLVDGKVRVSPASADELLKIGAVYVAPPGYEEAARVLGDQRLVHLVGPDHAGKFAMAHALARQCAPGAGLRIRALRCSEDAWILDLLEDPNCPKQSIFIMRDAFISPGLIRRDFHRNLGALQEILYINNQFLILTTDSELPADTTTGRRQTVDVPPLPAARRAELLDKHYDYYSIPESWRPSAADMALRALEHPYQFDLFAARLQRLEATPRRPQLEVLIRDIKDSAPSVLVWFDGLDPNQRYFAMLACLLPGLSLDNLWRLYENAYLFLKSQGIRLEPPLNYGREDLLRSIEARRTEFGTVEFNSPIFAQGALAQAQHNYREQFRLMLPKFAEAIETTVADKRRAGREQRQALTTAIGLLGQADLRLVRPVLLQMAQHSDMDVRLAAAEVLRRICDVEAQQPPVANLLAGWARDARPRVRWTAAATYSKLHLFLGEEALEALGDMAADAHEDVRREVAYSLESIFRRAPDDVIASLNDVQTSTDVNIGRTVRAAVGRIAKNPKGQASYFYDSARQLAFWPLADQVIRHGSVEQAKSVLSLVRSWLEKERDNSRTETLEEALLSTAGELVQQRHEMLKDTFGQWLADAPEMSPLYLSARRLAQAMVYIYPIIIIDEADLSPPFSEDWTEL